MFPFKKISMIYSHLFKVEITSFAIKTVIWIVIEPESATSDTTKDSYTTLKKTQWLGDKSQWSVEFYLFHSWFPIFRPNINDAPINRSKIIGNTERLIGHIKFFTINISNIDSLIFTDLMTLFLLKHNSDLTMTI